MKKTRFHRSCLVAAALGLAMSIPGAAGAAAAYGPALYPKAIALSDILKIFRKFGPESQGLPRTVDDAPDTIRVDPKSLVIFDSMRTQGVISKERNLEVGGRIPFDDNRLYEFSVHDGTVEKSTPLKGEEFYPISLHTHPNSSFFSGGDVEIAARYQTIMLMADADGRLFMLIPSYRANTKTLAERPGAAYLNDYFDYLTWFNGCEDVQEAILGVHRPDQEMLARNIALDAHVAAYELKGSTFKRIPPPTRLVRPLDLRRGVQVSLSERDALFLAALIRAISGVPTNFFNSDWRAALLTSRYASLLSDGVLDGQELEHLLFKARESDTIDQSYPDTVFFQGRMGYPNLPVFEVQSCAEGGYVRWGIKDMTINRFSGAGGGIAGQDRARIARFFDPHQPFVNSTAGWQSLKWN